MLDKSSLHETTSPTEIVLGHTNSDASEKGRILKKLTSYFFKRKCRQTELV